MSLKKVTAIIVLYKPSFDSIQDVVKSAAQQCDYVITIDNSDEDNTIKFKACFQSLLNVHYYPLLGNYGIAYAQNIGIQKAIELNSHYTIFFDQDSVPTNAMVKTLIENYNHLKSSNIKVATIGPLPINSQTNEEYKPRIFGHESIIVRNQRFYKTKQIISSGSLMEIEIFNMVGDFDEQLFIDGVDHEWCWRAKKQGYETFLSTSASLIHNLGEGDKKLFGFRVAITSPFRLYYQYRNYVILAFRPYTPFYWKTNNLIKYFVKMVYYPILYNDMNVLKKITGGIFDGFKMVFKKNKDEE